jgi:A-kinase anchor protein 1
MIRNCFPVNHFPQLTLNQINAGPIATAPLYLQENYPNDVIMSSLVSAGHLFLQQPTHPTYDALVVLNHLMQVTYTEHDAPAISSPSVGIIVAATVPSLPGWYRALIVGVSEDEAFCDVKYVDYGGCSRLETSGLRQIRMDFMNLLFILMKHYIILKVF